MSRLLTLLALGVLALSACTREEPRFVGAARCADCHAQEYSTWQRSQHAVAMQPATQATVLGDFTGASIAANGEQFRFTRSGDRFVVSAKRSSYDVQYTFGVWPLQQYLLKYSGGRLQALSVAWDARPKNAGGQRWFYLGPEAIVQHASYEHWAGRGYNWNFMCADCHSTGVRKNYEANADTFHTTFSEINVACEACHGPASEHVRWGGYPGWARKLFWKDTRLQARLDERRDVKWTLATGAKVATRSAPRTTDREIETCAQCHARRTHIADGYEAGKRLLDHYVPALLTSDIYYPDGQQREEVYTYGSFLQSKMYSKGVTCSDCHDPHSAKPRLAGNAVCGQCHRLAVYDTSAHTLHARGSTGASCVACHMPDTTYMRIDARHDHSIRIPRPDLSELLGTPNACTRCHVNRDARWAANAIRARYPVPTEGFQYFAKAFAADDYDDPVAADSLLSLAMNASQPAFVRASAIARLARHNSPAVMREVPAWLSDAHPMMRLAALALLESQPLADRVRLATPLLSDSLRALRKGAAWLLADAKLDDTHRRAFESAASEFIVSERYNADQPEERVVLGLFYQRRGRLDSAVTEYQAALQLEPRYAQARALLNQGRRR